MLIRSLCNSSKIIFPLEFELERIKCIEKLIEWTTTLRSSTQTWNLLVFNWEFVIIRYFLTKCNIVFWVYNNLLCTFNKNDFSVTVRLEEKENMIVRCSFLYYRTTLPFDFLHSFMVCMYCYDFRYTENWNVVLFRNADKGARVKNFTIT